jgi:hypothetical protein
MNQQQPTLSTRDVARAICAITGKDASKRGTVGDWHRKFPKAGFNLADFVLMRSGNAIGVTELSEKTIQALVVYMHGRNFNEIETITQLNRYFASIHSFKLVEVRVTFSIQLNKNSRVLEHSQEHRANQAASVGRSYRGRAASQKVEEVKFVACC